MAETKHTPGPLHAGHIGIGEHRRECVFTSDSHQVCEIVGKGPRAEADAALYAAAPELFRELDAICAALEEGDTVTIEPGSVKAVSVAAAIAKATGETR